MLNSTTWLYGAEVLPIALRSKVMGLAAASHFIVNVGSKFIWNITGLIGRPPLSRYLRYPIASDESEKLTGFSPTVTEAGPSAFANIHENYYYVFVCCSFFFLVIAYFYFP